LTYQPVSPLLKGRLRGIFPALKSQQKSPFLFISSPLAGED
jgi:hypothetical protein